jgi:cytochrome c553
MKTRVRIGNGIGLNIGFGVWFAAIALVALPMSAHAETLAEVIAQCAACHGPDGIARSADAPNLAGQHELYLYIQLKAFADGKRPHKEMRFMSRQLSDAEMREIAHYYEQLPR